MEINNKDLLNYSEIESMINCNFINEKASIIANKLIKYCFILNNSLYTLADNVTYVREDAMKNENKDAYDELTQTYSKTYVNIFKNSNIDLYSPQLTILLTVKNNNIVFNNTITEIHFKNGYVDLKEHVFKERILNKHYITEYIKRDYEPSSKKQRNLIMEILKKTYPLDEDMKAIFYNLGSAISGMSSRDQTTLFLLGDGSSGKSGIMLLTKAVLECYFKELKSDTFTQGNPKIDKILNTFSNEPHVRIMWVNEMKDLRLDETLFKSFCEGDLQTTKLYEDGQFNFKHYGKCFITANTMPNIKIDTGVKRRFIGYTHLSKFVDNKKEVDEINNVYLKNKLFVEDIIRMNLLNAFFDILCKYCKKWLEGSKPKYTINFKDTKSTVIDTNDFIQDFVDSKLTLTLNPEDKISKDEMHKLFSTTYTNKHLTTLQVITSLKEKKITYSSQVRCPITKIKGCFTGVKLQTELKVEDVKEYNMLTGTNHEKLRNDHQKLYIEHEELKKNSELEINRLKDMLKAMESQNKIKPIEIKQQNMFKPKVESEKKQIKYIQKQDQVIENIPDEDIVGFVFDLTNF